jgi:hypothetical protein
LGLVAGDYLSACANIDEYPSFQTQEHF